jgi:hypothetical protein
MYRQGDVLIVPVKRMPETLKPVAREKGRAVLARGELMGHAHAIKNGRAALFRDPTLGAIFMSVSGNASVALVHEEHDTIIVPPGNYRVIRQREYSPEELRVVGD